RPWRHPPGPTVRRRAPHERRLGAAVGPRGRGDVRSARAGAVPPRAVRAHRRRVPDRRGLVRPLWTGGLAPQARQPQRPAHDGHRVRPLRLTAAGAGRLAARQDVGARAARPVGGVLRPARAHPADGRSVAHGPGPRAGRRRPAGGVRARPGVAHVRPRGRQPAAGRRQPGGRGRPGHPPAGAVHRDPRGYRVGTRRTLPGGVDTGPSRARAALALGGRPRAAPTPGRRALLPGVAGAACLLLFALMLVVQLIGGEKPQLILWVPPCSLITVSVAFLAGLL